MAGEGTDCLRLESGVGAAHRSYVQLEEPRACHAPACWGRGDTPHSFLRCSRLLLLSSTVN